MKKLFLWQVILVSLVLLPLLSFAQRGTTTFVGPGFKMERHQGWFGSQQTVYQDALGNRLDNRKGWFGRRKNQAQIMGTGISQDPWNTAVTGPNGEVLVQQRRGWFGGKDTTVDTNTILQRMKTLF
jgi:hypothetical protein